MRWNLQQHWRLGNASTIHVGREYGADPTEQIIGQAIKVHRHLEPGLLELVYVTCFCYELQQNGLAIERKAPLALVYIELDCSYELTLSLREPSFFRSSRSSPLAPVHASQMLTDLLLSGFHSGSLRNFNGAR